MARAKVGRTPKSLKLPWDMAANGAAMSASEDGGLVVVAGELGALARVDLDAREVVPWESVQGFVTSLAVTRDGRSVAIGATGGEQPYVELRDASGAVTGTIPVPRNARVAWSRAGDLLVARIGANVDVRHEDLAFLDPTDHTCRILDVGPEVDSLAACFVGDGSSALAVVRRTLRPDRDADLDAHRFLRVSRSGLVHDLGATRFSDAYSAMVPVGTDRALVLGVNFGWCLVDAQTGAPVAQQEDRRPVICAWASEGGFWLGKDKRAMGFDASGKALAGMELTLKARVDGVAFARGLVLVCHGRKPNRVEITALADVVGAGPRV